MRRQWWRSNALWLVVVPVALVAMVAASSYRVKTFWWDEGMHHATSTAAAGRFTTSHGSYTDPAGTHSRTFDVRFSALGQQPPPSDDDVVPKGAIVLGATLDFRADPSVPMDLCRVVLVDSDGHVYGGDAGSEDPFDQVSTCVPAGHEGPEQAVTRSQPVGVVEPGHDRPAAWTVTPLFLVPRTARIVQARVVFTDPDYVALPLPPS